ncbi:MAG TPA: succinate dehydrogenase, hydrophobic membrane anchor protein [Xanthomonadales bacterium]|nr:succinate dehydrogenase, hydrophobic membrane anchor protein [Xanthomonadales bacterium]
MSIVNPLARARGHGSAKQGVHHWYLQRATAVLLTGLVVWLLYAVNTLSGAGYESALSFLSSPFNAAAALLLTFAGLYHAMLGLQVVIEDYVHSRGLEIALQFVVKGGCYIGMVISTIYILQIAIA